MSKDELTSLVNELTLKQFDLPINFINGNPPLFEMFNTSFEMRRDNKRLLLPNFEKTNTVAILSDYGGEAPNSKYLTYTFTFADYDYLGGIYSKEILNIRTKYGLYNPFKEIAFKDLRYGPVQRALKEYLHLMNWGVNGLVFTLVIHKDVISVIGPNNANSLKGMVNHLENENYGKWKPKMAEKLQRIVGTMVYLTNLLIPKGKKIFWMTDDDSIVANERMSKAAVEIYNNAIHSFEGKEYPIVGYAKPWEKGTDPLFLDILSLSDLVAGSVEHYFTKKTALDNQNFSDGANEVLMWLSDHGLMLKKHTFLIEPEDGKLKHAFIDFDRTVPLENVEYIDVTL